MTTSSIAIGVCLTDEQALDLESFALACGTDADFISLLVDEGLLQPVADQPDQPDPPDHPEWRFGGEAIARVRRIRRLQRDFEANLQSVAVMLDLLDEIERLRAQLQRAGLQA